MVATYNVLGKPIGKVEGPEKVTGAAKYTADFHIPGTLIGKTLKSSHAHARIVKIDTSAAKALPGVVAVITGADVQSGGLWGRDIKDVPVIAYEKVRFIGERVAAVAAVDADTAQAALDLIEVEYEPLPTAITCDEALASGAPILHPDFNSYRGFRYKQETPSNIHLATHFERGDVEAGFAESDRVFEATYETQRMHQGYLEPQAVLIHIDGGRTHVWLCSKVPYNTRESLATAGGLPEEEILFHHTYIGGDFGGKGNSRNTPVAYYLAKASGRPVKIVTDYVEEFGAGNPRHHTISKLKTGVKNDGTIVAHTVEYIVDSGAYASFKPYGTISGANQGAGPYRLPNVTIDSKFVYTNNIPGGFMRAPGEPQGVFALESHLDDIARQMGFDPSEFRRKNLMVEGEETGWGEHLEHVRAIETLDAAIEASGYNAPKAPGIGRGIAVGDRGTGGGEGTSQVTLKPDGTIVVGTPIFDQGTGVYTILTQVAAEELSAPLDSIEIEIWNTDALTSDAGVAGSRATRVNTIVAYEAAQEAKRNLLELAARHWQCSPDVLSFVNGEVRRSDIEEAVRWQDLLSETGETVSGRGHIAGGPRGAQHLTNFIAQVAEVSVDPETGETKLLKLTTVQETGTIVNPIGHQGQINGGVNQGIGYAMMEDVMVNEEGRVTTLSFGDYKIPCIKDIPEQITVNLDSPYGFGPYNVRSIGEGPHIPVAPAIANAIADATGARIRQLPLTSERVYNALKDR